MMEGGRNPVATCGVEDNPLQLKTKKRHFPRLNETKKEKLPH